MHQQRSRSAAETDDAIDQAVLGLLLGDRPIWAIDEIVLEVNDRVAALDALRRLRVCGLVYTIGGEYLIASRAAARMAELWQ